MSDAAGDSGSVPVSADLFRDVLARMKSALSDTDTAAGEVADNDRDVPQLFGLSPAAHLAQLEGMLSRCNDHPVMGPSLRQRVEQLRAHIAKDLTGPQT